MWISNVAAGGLLIFLGMIIRVYNLGGLIAGYNTASPEKKAKVNEKALTRFVGMMLIVSGTVLLLGGIFVLFNIAPWFMMAVSWSFFFVVIVFGLFYVNLSPKFKNQNGTTRGSFPTNS